VDVFDPFIEGSLHKDPSSLIDEESLSSSFDEQYYDEM